MRTMKWMLIGIAVLFCMNFPVFAEDMKIGVIDSQKILHLSNYGKTAKAEFEKKTIELGTDLQGKEKELMELKEKIEREALVMSPEMREQKERDFRIKLGDFQALEKKYKQENLMLNQKLSQKIQKDVIEIVEEIGKKDGYMLIFEKGTLIFSRDTIDISDQVIEIYNQSYEKELKAGGKK